MNLFISSSKCKHTAVPLVMGLLILIIMNMSVALLPDGAYMRRFKASVLTSQQIGNKATVILFGDSRATRFRKQFFLEETLPFACEDNTVIFSKLLFDQILSETDVRPNVMILTLGANNYSKNSIFTIRDFAIRRLASFSDIIDFASYRGGFAYMVDALFARMFPVYGRRMEIRRLRQIKQLMKSYKQPITVADVGQMTLLDPLVLNRTPSRSTIADHEYWLVYKRSIYPRYELSRLHTGMLETLIDTAIRHGATVVTVQLPVEPKMRQLEQEMVGTIFDEYLADLQSRKPIIHLDLRDDLRFEFQDLNHLSFRGSRDLTETVFNPLIAEILEQQPVEKTQGTIGLTSNEK